MPDDLPDPALPPDAPTCARHPQRPAATTCSHCGNFSCDECDSLLEGSHVCATCVEEGRVQAASIPWARRNEIGLLGAAWQTVLAVSADPASFFDRVRNGKEDLSDAALFAFLVSIPAGIMGAVYQSVFFGLVLSPGGDLGTLLDGLGPEIGAQLAQARTGWVATTMLTAIAAPFLTVIFHMVAGLLHHLALSLLGGTRRELDMTLRAGLFAVGINFWAVIPILGWFVGLWVETVKVIAYSHVHETPWWKSLAAISAPWCLFCCGFGGLWALIMGAVVAGTSAL